MGILYGLQEPDTNDDIPVPLGVPPCPFGASPLSEGENGHNNAMRWHIGPLREGAVGKADWGSTAWTTNSRKQRCPPRTPKPPLADGCLSPDGPKKFDIERENYDNCSMMDKEHSLTPKRTNARKTQPLRRSTAIIGGFALVAAAACPFASGICLRHAWSLSGASAEDWFELSRLFRFAEAACLFVLVSMLIRHVFDMRRLRLCRVQTSIAWVAVSLFVALLMVPALWLLDYHRELSPKLEQVLPVERFVNEFPGFPLPEEGLSVVLNGTYLDGYLSSHDRIPFAVRGNRFIRIRPDGFHQVYGSVDVVPADSNLVYIHSCRSRYRSTLHLQGIHW